MKILITATVQSHISQFHRPLVDILHTYGYEVHIAAKDNLEEKNGLKLDFVDRVYNVPFSRSPLSLDNIRAYRRIKRILKDEQYEIVHCNTPMGGIITRLAARKYRKKGLKVYYTAHGFHFYQGAPKKNWLIYYPIEKLFSRFTDKLITITYEDYKLAKERFYCDVKHIHGVGVDEHRYHPVSLNEQNKIKNDLGFGLEQKIILCIGELLPNKNQKMAIRVMGEIIKNFPTAQLLLAGNGPEDRNLKKEILELGLNDNVRMLGYCTYLEKYQQISDIVISCSKREGLPLNIVEAMLSGNPVVATVNRGHKELIEDEKNGFLVDVDDDISMAKNILKLLNNNDLRSKISNNALDFAKFYDYSNVKREMKEIYFTQNVQK